MVLQKHPRYLRLFRNFRYRISLDCKHNSCLRWGCLGLKVCNSGNLFYNEVEAFRRYVQPSVKPFGFLYCTVPFERCLTKKSVGSRMGHGKGVIDIWYSSVISGTVIFEVKFININGYSKVRSAFFKAQNKISLRTKIIDNR